MGGFIEFDDNLEHPDWSSPNWIFRGMIDHAVQAPSCDKDVAEYLTAGKYSQHISLGDLLDTDSELYSRVCGALELACDRVLSGKLRVAVNARELPPPDQLLFRNAAAELKELLNRHAGE